MLAYLDDGQDGEAEGCRGQVVGDGGHGRLSYAPHAPQEEEEPRPDEFRYEGGKHVLGGDHG